MSQHFKGLRLRPKYQPSSQQESSRTMSSWSALYVDDLSTASVAVCGTACPRGPCSLQPPSRCNSHAARECAAPPGPVGNRACWPLRWPASHVPPGHTPRRTWQSLRTSSTARDPAAPTSQAQALSCLRRRARKCHTSLPGPCRCAYRGRRRSRREQRRAPERAGAYPRREHCTRPQS